MTKYEMVRGAVGNLLSAADDNAVAEDEALEALIVVAVEALTKGAGRKRAADVLRYELSNVGGDVDTVFLRSR